MEQKEIYIETERIIIRNFKQKDAEGLLEYLSNPRVNCFAGDRLCSEEAAWAYMQYSPKDMLRYAVSLKKDDFIIGDVFALRENEDTYNVGWHFNKRFEGKGFACEAAAGLLDYLFREAGARRIYGFVEDMKTRSHTDGFRRNNANYWNKREICRFYLYSSIIWFCPVLEELGK